MCTALSRGDYEKLLQSYDALDVVDGVDLTRERFRPSSERTVGQPDICRQEWIDTLLPVQGISGYVRTCTSPVP
jgi:hypothetical protein